MYHSSYGGSFDNIDIYPCRIYNPTSSLIDGNRQNCSVNGICFVFVSEIITTRNLKIDVRNLQGHPTSSSENICSEDDLDLEFS